ncbi:DNA primase [Alphaproteobacteria bacterium]|nr:DNA primase [Alphaproteobacteria bacterium]
MSNETVREIIERISIVEVIGKYISLTKKGSNFFGLSPFKNEKTPSFSVNEEKKMFKCFSTGEGGNVFDFLIKVKGYTFKEALNELADKSGVQLQSYKGNQDFQTIYNINEFAKNYFHKELSKNNKYLNYYKNVRKFNEESINFFKLGSLSDQKDFIKTLMGAFSEEELLKSSILKKNNGKLYSFFFNRVIIPISGISNKVFGFGARTIGNDSPKYINSGETKVFKKKNILYNESCLINNSEKKIIITEGYFDVIKMHQHGIKNVVAPLGTSINHEKIIEITRRGLECIVCLDGDVAGRNSMLRLLDNLLKDQNFELGVKFVLLPKDKDPDQLLDDNKINYLKELLDNPLSIESFIEKYLEKFSLSENIETQYKGKKYITQLISNIANKDLREIIKNHFKGAVTVKKINSSEFLNIKYKNDLKTKFSAGVILTFIENPTLREKVYDIILIARFDGIFEEIRKFITKKEHFNKSPEVLYEELDTNGLNFSKNRLFSREIRRLCKFANQNFKGDFYQEISKALNYINK